MKVFEKQGGKKEIKSIWSYFPLALLEINRQILKNMLKKYELDKERKSMTVRKRKREEKANIPKHLMQTFKAKKEFNNLSEQKM